MLFVWLCRVVEMFHNLQFSVKIIGIVTRIHYHIQQRLCPGDKTVW